MKVRAGMHRLRWDPGPILTLGAPSWLSCPGGKVRPECAQQELKDDELCLGRASHRKLWLRPAAVLMLQTGRLTWLGLAHQPLLKC